MDVVLKELYLSEDENGSPKEKNKTIISFLKKYFV